MESTFVASAGPLRSFSGLYAVPVPADLTIEREYNATSGSVGLPSDVHSGQHEGTASTTSEDLSARNLRFLSQADLSEPSSLWYNAFRHTLGGAVRSVYHPPTIAHTGTDASQSLDQIVSAAKAAGGDQSQREGSATAEKKPRQQQKQQKAARVPFANVRLEEVGLEAIGGPTNIGAVINAPKREDGTIRIVCISDTHGHHRAMTNMIPGDTDILIHAGDFTNCGKQNQIEEFARWLREEMSHIPHKVVIAGNHELTLAQDELQQDGQYVLFNLPDPRTIPETEANLQWLALNPSYAKAHPSSIGVGPGGEQRYYDPEVTMRRSCTYLRHEGVALSSDGRVVRLERIRGVDGTISFVPSVSEETSYSRVQNHQSPTYENLTIFGSPYQPWFFDWAFNLSRKRPEAETNPNPAAEDEVAREGNDGADTSEFKCCREAWATMDPSCDILITHGPPLGHGDWVPPQEQNRTHRGQNRRQLYCAKAGGSDAPPPPQLLDRFGCADLLDWCVANDPLIHVFGHFHHGYGVTTTVAEARDEGNAGSHQGGSNSAPSFCPRTIFVNASVCDQLYDQTNLRAPIVVDLPIAALKKRE